MGGTIARFCDSGRHRLEGQKDLLVGEALQLRDAPSEVELPPDTIVVPRLTAIGKGQLQLQTPDCGQDGFLLRGRDYPLAVPRRKLPESGPGQFYIDEAVVITYIFVGKRIATLA